ncbi:MAG TPA: RIO1 family regulatory kinase/ATPase [Thermoplasmata archaeon]|nr:RIO1 family regulatory kinase/ATPase [Thermoplasmata archaeon]
MPNSPYLDATVRWRIKSGTLEDEEPDYGSRVEAVLRAGLATEVVRPISAGKEAEVLLATLNGAPIAIKIYRLYRTSHRGGRPVKADTMGWRAAHEFDMLLQAWKGGAPVPTPARRAENMFSMRYLSDGDGPAPRLSDVRLEDPQPMFSQILDGIERLARAGVVHGDLSAFNILVCREEPWLIDLSEAMRVDRTGGAPWVRLTEAKGQLTHGLTALNQHFRRYRLAVEVEPFVSRIVDALDRFHVFR